MTVSLRARREVASCTSKGSRGMSASTLNGPDAKRI
jgi:hypothetical protein